MIILKPVIDKVFRIKECDCYMYNHKGEYFLSPVSKLVFVEDSESLIVYIEEK